MRPIPTPQPDAFLLLLDAPQVKVFAELVELLGRPDRTLAGYHACAERVASLRPDEAGYGAGWVKELCAALSRHAVPVSPTLAYRLIRFADLYPGDKGRAQVRQLDGQVSWESMMRIIHVEDPQTRELILRRAADERLSSRSVMALIRETTGYRRARGGRPQPRPATHPNRALRDLRSLASKWPVVCAAWSGEGNTALKRAARLRPGQVTDAFLDDLEAVVPLVEEMGRTAGQLSTELVRLLKRLRGGRPKSTRE